MILIAIICIILLFRLVLKHKKLSMELKHAESRLVNVQSQNDQRDFGAVRKEYASDPDYSPNPLATGIPNTIPSPKDDPIEQEIATRQRDVSTSLGQFVTPNTKPFAFKSQFEINTEKVQENYIKRTSKARISQLSGIQKMRESLQAHVVYNDSVSEIAEVPELGDNAMDDGAGDMNGKHGMMMDSLQTEVVCRTESVDEECPVQIGDSALNLVDGIAGVVTPDSEIRSES